MIVDFVLSVGINCVQCYVLEEACKCDSGTECQRLCFPIQSKKRCSLLAHPGCGLLSKETVSLCSLMIQFIANVSVPSLHDSIGYYTLLTLIVYFQYFLILFGTILSCYCFRPIFCYNRIILRWCAVKQPSYLSGLFLLIHSNDGIM